MSTFPRLQGQGTPPSSAARPREGRPASAGDRRRSPEPLAPARNEVLADPEEVRRAFRRWRVGGDDA